MRHGLVRSFCALVLSVQMLALNFLAPSQLAVAEERKPRPAEILSLAVGSGHSCVVFANKTVQCWGNSSSGQLGDRLGWWESNGPPGPRGPVVVRNLPPVTQVAVGHSSSCALADDRIKCWGWQYTIDNPPGVGGVSFEEPLDLMLDSRTSLKSDRGSTYCSLASAPPERDDTICWENPNSSFGPANVRFLYGPKTASVIDIGFARYGWRNLLRVCGLWSDGAVSCSDEDDGEQLYDLGVPIIAKAILQTGPGNWCALLPDGTVRCLHHQDYRFGDDVVANLSDVTEMYLDNSFGCAVKTDSNLWCWGQNMTLNNLWDLDPYQIVDSPRLVPGFTKVSKLSVGRDEQRAKNMCFVANENRVYCDDLQDDSKQSFTQVNFSLGPVADLTLSREYGSNRITFTPIAFSGTPTPSVSYQWVRCSKGALQDSNTFSMSALKAFGCKTIPRETKPSYKIKAADKKRWISAIATGKNSNGKVVIASDGLLISTIYR
jgi:hypothetical protein